MYLDSQLLIRLGVSLVMITFGLDQLLNPDPWTKAYLPKFFRDLPFLGKRSFMRLHALGNLALGLIFFLGVYAGFFAYLVLLWWLTILPFAVYANWRIAIRDFAIICAILALLLLQL